METDVKRATGHVRALASSLQIVVLVFVVGLVCYFVPKLAGIFMMQPQRVWPLWPGCAVLVSMLLLVPRKTWLLLIPVALAAFAVYDFQQGVPWRSIAWFAWADLVEVLTACIFLGYLFDGLPRLDSIRNLAAYLLSAAVVAPFAAAFFAAPGIGTSYWTSWRICFFSEVLAFLTLTPAILGFAGSRQAIAEKPVAYYLEALAMTASLGLIGYLSFTASAGSHEPALLYSLVPLLLWSSLRFGPIGISFALIVVTFLSIWGVVHGRGPFVGSGPNSEFLSIQLFLIFTAIPFMVLAVLAEERAQTDKALRRREKDLVDAQRVAQVGSWQWNPRTHELAWSKELYRIAGRDPNQKPPAFEKQRELYTAKSWNQLQLAVEQAMRSGTPYQLDLEMVRPDGSTRWITDRGEVLRDASGRISWLLGTAQDITDRKHAEDALRQSEEKFRSVFRDAEVGMVIVSIDGTFLAANDSFCEYLGYSEEELLHRTVQSITHAEDWPDFSQKLSATIDRGTSFHKFEKRCLHKTGRVVIMESSASLIRDPEGEPRFFVGSVLDITQRKQVEAAMSSVNRRLIEAHEEERIWIARELHDDFNQRIALLAVDLERIRQGLPASLAELGGSLEHFIRYVGDLGSDVQALSHRLHSSKLEYLGLAAASRAFCRECSERQHISIDFDGQDIPRALPKEISLCLFRVLQEALQNAIKHSGARQFSVSLRSTSNEIRLVVRDSGIGFDWEKAMSGHGLGLTSMKERLKLANGQLLIDSKLEHGTTIQACIPLKPEATSARASA